MIDPITFEVLRHRLSTIVDEGAAVMRNVSGSPSVAQSNDCNVALLTAKGEGVIIGRTIASHGMSCTQTARYVLGHYQDNPGIGPGDMFFTNHPYIGTPHQTCGVMVAPIFVGDRIVAWTGAGIHFGDVGGTVPGQVSIGARSIWDEAIPMPPVKLVEGGILRRDLEEDFLIRSRTRIQNAVDLKAMIGSNNAIARRVQAIVERYGTDTLIETLDRIIETSERKLRHILDAVPDGAWDCENFIDYYDAGRLRVYACRLKLTKHAGTLTFDFSRSSKQAPAVVNSTLAATEGFLLRAMLGIFGFAIERCPAAIQRVMEIRTAEGTIADCSWPAGISKGTTSVTQSVWQVATHCLSQMLLASRDYRDRAIAVSRGNLTILDLLGTDQYGGPFAAVLQECSLAAGSGANILGDGVDTGGVTEPEVSIPNVESNEFRYPVLYLYRRQRIDSAGAGAHRGGVGLSMAFTPHRCDEIPDVMIHTHGVCSPSALGIEGGYPGVTNVLTIKRNTNLHALFQDGAIPSDLAALGGDEVEHPPPFIYTRLRKGDVFECGGGGGGGYGDPIARSPGLVARDVAQGLVSRADAEQRYGVVLDSGGGIDAAATEARRKAIRDERRRTSMADTAGRGSATRDTHFSFEAFASKGTAHVASYVIREYFDPSSWALIDARLIVPQAEP